MRLVVFILFWVGVVTATRELWFVRKLPLTRAEKLYPAIAFVLAVAAQPVLYLIGASTRVAAFVMAFSLGGILSAWALQRRVRRTARGL